MYIYLYLEYHTDTPSSNPILLTCFFIFPHTAAYKSADGKKIDGRRVLVDVERGRTVKGWRPRRLGGGLGSTREAQPDESER